MQKTTWRPPYLRALEEAFPDYVAKSQLGAGSFGRVILMENRKSGAQFAVKALRKDRMEELKMTDKVQKEISLMSSLNHPNVIRLQQVQETSKYIMIVMEYAQNGELFDYITQRGRLSEGTVRRFFQQIISGLEHCHRRTIVHRDLKPENILLDHDWNVKIADFGLGDFMSEGHFLKASCGSPNYAAPEVLSGKFYCGQEVDVWSTGVVLYTLLCSRLPFDENTHSDLFEKIKSASYSCPSHVSLPAQDLLKRLLVVDPTARATIPEIKRHPWFLPWFLPIKVSEAIGIDISEPTSPRLSPKHVNAIQNMLFGSFLDQTRSDGVSKACARSHGCPLRNSSNCQISSSGSREGSVWSEEKGVLKERLILEPRWCPGTSLRVKSWFEAMTRICDVLHSFGIRWKNVSPYCLKCYMTCDYSYGNCLSSLAKVGTLPGHPNHMRYSRPKNYVVQEPYTSYYSDRHFFDPRENGSFHQKTLFHEKKSVINDGCLCGRCGSEGTEIIFEIQMYSVEADRSLLDVCFLGGSSQIMFLEFCSSLWSRLQLF